MEAPNRPPWLDKAAGQLERKRSLAEARDQTAQTGAQGGPPFG
jgi:hypothetical protein